MISIIHMVSIIHKIPRRSAEVFLMWSGPWRSSWKNATSKKGSRYLIMETSIGLLLVICLSHCKMYNKVIIIIYIYSNVYIYIYIHTHIPLISPILFHAYPKNGWFYKLFPARRCCLLQRCPVAVRTVPWPQALWDVTKNQLKVGIAPAKHMWIYIYRNIHIW